MQNLIWPNNLNYATVVFVYKLRFCHIVLRISSHIVLIFQKCPKKFWHLPYILLNCPYLSLKKFLIINDFVKKRLFLLFTHFLWKKKWIIHIFEKFTFWIFLPYCSYRRTDQKKRRCRHIVLIEAHHINVISS